MNSQITLSQKALTLGQQVSDQTPSLFSLHSNAKIALGKEVAMVDTAHRDSISLARKTLDGRLSELRKAAAILTVPTTGWIASVRTALGMSISDLARRLGVNPSTAFRIEENELEGTVNLSTLTKVANALDCDVVYALVPKQATMQLAKARARALAVQRLTRVQQSMALEDQALAPAVFDKLIEQKAAELLYSRGLWKDQLGVG